MISNKIVRKPFFVDHFLEPSSHIRTESDRSDRCPENDEKKTEHPSSVVRACQASEMFRVSRLLQSPNFLPSVHGPSELAFFSGPVFFVASYFHFFFSYAVLRWADAWHRVDGRSTQVWWNERKTTKREQKLGEQERGRERKRDRERERERERESDTLCDVLFQSRPSVTHTYGTQPHTLGARKSDWIRSPDVFFSLVILSNRSGDGNPADDFQKPSDFKSSSCSYLYSIFRVAYM